jgi:hypothetical protein
MSIKACPECGQNISTKADTCPSCGYPIAKNRKRSASQLGCLAFLLIFVGGFIAIAIEAETPTEKGVASVATDEPNTSSQQPDLDNSNEPVKSCDWKNMSSVMKDILIVDWSTGSKICELAANSLGRPIPTRVFRFLLNAAGLLHLKGAGEPDQIAYQIVEIIDARGLTDPQRMKDTIDIVFKAYTGSNGRVTPKDLNVAVRQSGMGLTLSDKGLYGVAALISVQKRNNGE